MVTAVFVLITLLILAKRKPGKSRKAVQERLARAA
jgi:putative ABC transport system permease protein